MKKVLSVFLVAGLIFSVGLLSSCSDDMQKYNTAVEGRELDKTNIESVLENALMVDVYDTITDCETIEVAYEEVEKDEQKKKTTYYLMATVTGYSFIDDYLTRTSGMSTFAAVIDVKKDKEGNYKIIGFKTNRDLITHEEREGFIAENFKSVTNPREFISEMTDVLYAKEEEKIRLEDDIDREFEFASEEQYVELLPINDVAYKELNSFFDEYPDWIGKIERKKGDTRFLFETIYVPIDPQRQHIGTLTFRKSIVGGDVVEEHTYTIQGDYVEEIKE